MMPGRTESSFWSKVSSRIRVYQVPVPHRYRNGTGTGMLGTYLVPALRVLAPRCELPCGQRGEQGVQQRLRVRGGKRREISAGGALPP